MSHYTKATPGHDYEDQETIHCSRCHTELERDRNWQVEDHKIEDCITALALRIQKLEDKL